MTDPIDDLLDRSAPVLADRGSTRDAALRQMITDARDTARPPKRSRRRVALLSGALALVLVGGAGVATANSDWLWSPDLNNPDRSYTYSSPTWGQCEIRVSRLKMANPFAEAEVNSIIDDWFASTDVEAAAAPYVSQYLAVLEEAQRDASEPLTDPRLADLNAVTAHEQALGEALHDELADHGFATGDAQLGWASSFSQVHCENEDRGAGE